MHPEVAKAAKDFFDAQPGEAKCYIRASRTLSQRDQWRVLRSISRKNGLPKPTLGKVSKRPVIIVEG